MRLTTKGRYALRAVIRLTQNEEGSPVSIREIAAGEELSAEFLEQIFYRLRKEGLVKSVRGPGGGFILSKSPESISILEILKAAGEEFTFTPCIDEPEKVCPRTCTCTAKNVWSGLEKTITSYLATHSLADITQKHNQVDAPSQNLEFTSENDAGMMRDIPDDQEESIEA